MNKIFYLLLSVGLFLGCSEHTTEVYGRTSYVYFSGDNPKEEKYSLVKKGTDGKIEYQYLHQKDTNRNIELVYHIDSKVLNFGPDEFIEIKILEFKTPSIPEFQFNIFEAKVPIIDGAGPIYFHEEHGLLLLRNVFGPTIIMLPLNSDVKTAREIFDYRH